MVVIGQRPGQIPIEAQEWAENKTKSCLEICFHQPRTFQVSELKKSQSSICPDSQEKS